MVNEILRILDRSLLFTISFMLIDILKVVCSSLVLFFLDRNWDEIDIEAWICLILFVIQNVFEILYFLSKLVQNLFKQKTVINIFLSGSEINFNPYEAKKNEKIMEYLYYLIMM